MFEKEKIIVATDYFNRAYKAHLNGKIDFAIENYKASIQNHPTAKAHTYLAWALSLYGKYEDAIKECLTAIELDPEYGNPYNDIGSYLISLGQHDEALAWLERALDAQDYDYRHYPFYNLGRIFERKGDYVQALRLYNEALDIEPDYELARTGVIRVITLLN